MVTAGARWRRAPVAMDDRLREVWGCPAEVWRLPPELFTAGRAWDCGRRAGEGTGTINKNLTGSGAASVLRFTREEYLE